MNYLKTLTSRLNLASEIEPQLAAFKPEPDHRSTLEKSTDSVRKLIETYDGKRLRLETEIAAAQEELRQVNIVIDGATRMHETLTQ